MNSSLQILLLFLLASLLRSAVPPMKTIFLIRHAESEENVMLNSAKRVWRDVWAWKAPEPSDVLTTLTIPGRAFLPSTTDADVSEEGRRQILEARECVRGLLGETNLVAHSPLKRAARTAHGVAREAEAEFVELECLRELSPAEFVMHGKTDLDARIEEFERWIEGREEEVIFAVGHSQYFLRMFGKPTGTFGNCDVWKMTYNAEGKIVNEGEETLPRSWISMERLFRYESVD